MSLRRLTRRVWFRAATFTVAAILFALVVGLVAPWIPFSPELDLGQGAVDQLLQILATSMLAVTTFSLTAMVTAYSAASRIATPRATRLLVEDPTSQNVLSTFVGAFAFSLVGIIALSTGYYGEEGRALLFLGTLVVIVIIVVTLLRWIGHLGDFGRMADIIDRVESAARESLLAYVRQPSMGARAAAASTATWTPVRATHVGYVTYIDLPALEAAAADASVDVRVAAAPGRVADDRTPLLHASGSVDDRTVQAMRDAFRVEAHRTYEQDPRLGLIALAEIASRALSPATNDAGTAIEVIAALERVFAATVGVERDVEVAYPHVTVEPLDPGELFVDAFRPIARDGSAHVEVAVRMQKALASLALGDPAEAPALRAVADDAAERARAALSPADQRVLDSVRARVWQ